MDLVLLADLHSLLTLSGVILIVALGLGAVIFVHELGHFLVAKACGVKCEKFFIGFDIGGYKLSKKWGETEYGIGILPLGGYVKMLGQDDDPAHIAEEMKRCQIAAGSPDAVEVTGPNGERYYVDRRSYLAKSVPQRMAIISAGVVMNVIFAFVFAVVAYGMGVKYMPSIVSETVPGSPAWRAGLEPGDEIVQIGGRVDPTFTQLRGGVTLGDMESGIPCVIRRARDGEEVGVTLRPEQTRGRGLATIGIISPRTLTLAEGMPVLPDSPAARARPLAPIEGRNEAQLANAEPDIAPSPDAQPPQEGFRAGDTIIRVNDTPVSDYRSFAAVLARDAGEPLRVTVRRKGTDDDVTFEVAPRPQRSLGLIMPMGPITAIQSNSPAETTGLKVGDTITAVDGQSLDTPTSDAAWTAESFPERMRQAALAGQSVTLTVLRDSEPVEIQVTPRVPTEFHAAVPTGAPMGVPALGIAYQFENRVAAVEPGTSAAAADIRPGDEIVSAKLRFADAAQGATAKPVTIALGPDAPNWASLLMAIQTSPVREVELTVRRGGTEHEVTLAPFPAEGLFVAERGFNFMPIERTRRADSFGQQLRYGLDETTEALTMVYRFLQKLGTQVPLTALGGPVTIATVAGLTAYEGMPQFLIFLTMLSANLAVINFLPIPLLDGGHMVFLAYEGLRGRPANERFVVAMHTAGFALIVSLMLFVLALDFGLIPRNL